MQPAGGVISSDAEDSEVAEVDECPVLLSGALFGEGVTAVPGGVLDGSGGRNRMGELVAGSHRESLARLPVCVRSAGCRRHKRGMSAHAQDKDSATPVWGQWFLPTALLKDVIGLIYQL